MTTPPHQQNDYPLAIGVAVGALVIVLFAYAIRDSRMRKNTVLANGIAAGLVPLQRELEDGETTSDHRED